ncbi:hypothetical protein BH10PSE3_BH10PSE3_29270 [soil metagenome]
MTPFLAKPAGSTSRVPPRMSAGLSAGAFLGAGEVSLVFLSFWLFGGNAERSVQMAVISFPVALVVWAAALILVGAPVGWVVASVAYQTGRAAGEP